MMMKQNPRAFLVLVVLFSFFGSCQSPSAEAYREETASPSGPGLQLSNNEIMEDAELVNVTNAEAYQDSLPIPEGYILVERITGDLNSDGKEDQVVMVKGTEPDRIVTNRFDEVVDRNRRGLLVYLSSGDSLMLASSNLACFYSENEDGGVYFPPEITVVINKGKLYLEYAHGRYGYWKYTFRYQNSRLQLIGYDAVSTYGPIINQETSINFLTKRKLTKENINPDTADGGDEVFEERWEDIPDGPLLNLAEIESFDELNLNR